MDAPITSQRLRSPVGPRSHFLPVTPIITLGSEFPMEMSLSNHAHYVAFHEFLHYEQFVSNPMTIFQYARRMMEIVRTLGGHKGIEIASQQIESSLSSVELPFKSEGWDDGKVAELQSSGFRIGLSALFEGGAMLDCFCKPPGSWFRKEGAETLKRLFSDRNLLENREHIIGTEACLAAVGAPNFDLESYEYPDNLSFAANLPTLVLVSALGTSFKDAGFRGKGYDDVLAFASENLPELLHSYQRLVENLLLETFTNRSGLEWVLEVPNVRDLSILGMHAIATLCTHTVIRSYPPTAPAFPLLAGLWPFKNVLRTFEMRNPKTLARYAVPTNYPRYAPVPAILFNHQSITSMWVEFPKPRNVILKWATSQQMTHSQYLGWMSWCVAAIVNEITEAVIHKQGSVSCPFYKWVRDRYAEMGEFDEAVVFRHLSNMCNGPFSVTIDREAIQKEVRPRPEYCTCELNDSPREISCLFRSVVDRLETSSQTVDGNRGWKMSF